VSSKIQRRVRTSQIPDHPEKTTHQGAEKKGLAHKGGNLMTEKEEIAGYYTEGGDIYCVECINKNREMMEKIEQAITTEDSEKSLYFCEGCKKEIK